MFCPNSHTFVAEVIENEKKTIARVIGLEVAMNPRLSHSDSIGIMVHKDYQGIGI